MVKVSDFLTAIELTVLEKVLVGINILFICCTVIVLVRLQFLISLFLLISPFRMYFVIRTAY